MGAGLAQSRRSGGRPSPTRHASSAGSPGSSSRTRLASDSEEPMSRLRL